MTSLIPGVTHSTDLCHNPHIISERERHHQKGDVKGHFPSHCLVLLRTKKSPQDREKKGDLSFCLLAIDSASVKKHNRVKSVSKSGEDRSGSVPFSLPQT